MSQEQGKNFLDLITEYAKTTDLDVNVDEVKEAFPEFYEEGAIFKQKESEALFDEPIDLPNLSADYNDKEIESLQSEVEDLKKIIANHAKLLAEIKQDVNSKTPAVDEALIKQRLDAFQKMHFDLEERIEANEMAINQEKSEPKKKRAWWMPLFLLLNLIILGFLLFLLWKQSSSSVNETKSESASLNKSQSIETPQPIISVETENNTEAALLETDMISDDKVIENAPVETKAISNLANENTPDNKAAIEDNAQQKAPVVKAKVKAIKEVKPVAKKQVEDAKKSAKSQTSSTNKSKAAPKPATKKAEPKTPAVFFK